MAKVPADWSAWLALQAMSGLGDGSDGAVTFDGSTTVLGLVPSSSVYTLTRDIFCTNITFTGSASIKAAGYRIYARGTIDTTGSSITSNSTTSIIAAFGANGATGSGGGATGGPGGIVLGGSSGGQPVLGGSGLAGQAITASMGGVGGSGGNGNSGSGGAGGTVTAPSALLGSPRITPTPSLLGMILGNGGGGVGAITLLQGGSGGGAGGGGTASYGGGGGAGGGILGVMARTLKLKTAADISCRGGSGGAGASSGTGTGGGGGGGGGVLILCYGSYSTGDSSVFSSATNCPGGPGGALFGTGTNGSAGATGTCITIPLGGF
jgi:hypothetical protein